MACYLIFVAYEKGRLVGALFHISKSIFYIKINKKADVLGVLICSDQHFGCLRSEFYRDKLKLRQSLAKVGIAENRFEPYPSKQNTHCFRDETVPFNRPEPKFFCGGFIFRCLVVFPITQR